MKIRGILQGLLSGEDFSDHSTGKEDGNAPYHPAKDDCDFCDAWREALQLLAGQDNAAPVFSPGDEVLICNRAPGVVEAVRVQVDVRLGEADGPRPVGTFAAEFVSHRTPAGESAPEFTYWRDTPEGDVYERRESDRKMRIVRWGDDSSVAKPIRWEAVGATFDSITASFGPLVQIENR